MTPKPPVRIGEMRYLVTLALRNEVQDPSTTNLDEQYIRIMDMYAAIRPKNEEAFIGGEATTTPITHEIIFRWLPYESVTTFDTILRDIVMPNGQHRDEIYRIRQVEEWAGRQRFIIADAELESYT